ncbi:MAG TPA: DUF421 domain-containing protein [Algoriphagus sp.]|nr:DUF421 domain-containing protein [Algoriphagus sp.]
MEKEQPFELFDLTRLLIGDQLPYAFLLEVLLRAAVMFIVTLLVLRLSGKRGIKQLSIFELAILISLGSAAGDPMFYHDVGLLQAITVLVVVISLYKLMTYLTGKFEKIEEFVEGKPIKLIDNGKIIYQVFKREDLAYDELFSQLRQHSVSHLGQVKCAYMEASGDLSIFYFPDEEVIPGLPILPDIYDSPVSEFQSGKVYACKHCGNIEKLEKAEICRICEKNEWLPTDQSSRLK